MARFKADEVDNYGGNGGRGFFSLKNDKDVARVRFLYNDINDVEGFAVHQIETPNGKKRYVNCLRNYNDPIDVCPFCAEHMFQMAKLFIPLYNIDEDKVQVWERGKKFFAQISSLCAHYPDLVSHVFEIERNGKAGDTNTTYAIYEQGADDTTIEDLPEFEDILGSIVLDKSADDMIAYLKTGEFPGDNDTTGNAREEMPIRRCGSTSNSNNSRNNSSRNNTTPTRRTPSGRGGSGRGDRF